MDPSRVFDDDGNQCKDVWYRAGDNIVISTSALIETMLYGYYQFPERMDADADTHWMMDYMYMAIFNLACRHMGKVLVMQRKLQGIVQEGRRLLSLTGVTMRIV